MKKFISNVFTLMLIVFLCYCVYNMFQLFPDRSGVKDIDYNYFQKQLASVNCNFNVTHSVFKGKKSRQRDPTICVYVKGKYDEIKTFIDNNGFSELTNEQKSQKLIRINVYFEDFFGNQITLANEGKLYVKINAPQNYDTLYFYLGSMEDSGSCDLYIAFFTI